MGDFDEYLNPATDTDGGIDIMQDRTAFRKSQDVKNMVDNSPNYTGYTGEDRRHAALQILIGLGNTGYITSDPVKDAAAIDRWLSTGEASEAQETGGQAPTAGAGPV